MKRNPNWPLNPRLTPRDDAELHALRLARKQHAEAMAARDLAAEICRQQHLEPRTNHRYQKALTLENECRNRRLRLEGLA